MAKQKEIKEIQQDRYVSFMGARQIKFSHKNIVSSTSCLLGPEKLKTNEEVILAKGGFLNKWTAKPKTNALSGVKVVMAPKKDEEEDEFEIDFGDAKPKLQMPAALKKTTGNYLMGMKPDIAKA